MEIPLVNSPGRGVSARTHRSDGANGSPSHADRRFRARRCFAVFVLAAAVLLAPLLFAQTAPPRVQSADPTAGKVDDSVTLMGENLGKATVSSVFLSDDKMDYKAAIMDQDDAKIVFKVPKVKAGSYNVSVQVSNTIYLEPVRFTVQE